MAEIRLRIYLEDLQLYVHNPLGLNKSITLLPQGVRDDKTRHKATLTGGGLRVEPPFDDLDGSDIRFLDADGNAVLGLASKPSGNELFDLKDISSNASVDPKYLRDKHECPEDLNARLWFPPGKLTAEEAKKVHARGPRWRIGRMNNRILTDRLSFVSEPKTGWKVSVSRKATVVVKNLEPDADNMITLRLLNDDTRTCDEPELGKRYELKDYRFLYDLTDLVDKPSPEGVYGDKPAEGGGKFSDCLPICGEAQCG